MKKRYIILPVIAILLLSIAQFAFPSSATQIEMFLNGVTDPNTFAPASAGVVYTYSAGTTTNKTVWTDRGKTSAAQNPFTLNSMGQAQVYGEGIYKFVIKDAVGGATLYTYDDNISIGTVQGPWVDVSQYASLTAAVTAIGSINNTTLLISGTTTLTANTTVTDNITLLHKSPGLISCGTHTVLINGPLDASQSQVFDSSCGVNDVVFGVGSVKEIFAEWFGAAGDDNTDDTAEVTSAFNSAVNVKRVGLLAKTYKMTSPLVVPTGVEIEGPGGDVGKYKFYDCDGLEILTVSGAVSGEQLFHNFGIVSNSTGSNSYIAIKHVGDANTVTHCSNLRMHGLHISDFNMGIELRSAWFTEIIENYFINTFHAIKIKGQCVKTTIRDNAADRNGVDGYGTSVGVEVISTFDYDPGGTTELRPENVTIDNNLFYGFHYGIELTNVLESRVIHNDLDNSITKGINIITAVGNVNIDDNWMSTNVGNTEFIGIHVNPLNSPIVKAMNITKNRIISNVTSTNSIGIKIEQSGLNVTGNTIDGFYTSDIHSTSVETGAININDNICHSSAANTSIFIHNTAAGNVTNINGNECGQRIYVHPIVNAGVVNVGKNIADNATYITGYALMTSGATSVTVNYSSLVGGTPNFDSAMGITPMARVYTDIGTSGSAAGFTWGEAGDTSITIKTTAAYGGGDYKVYFEVFSMPTFMK